MALSNVVLQGSRFPVKDAEGNLIALGNSSSSLGYDAAKDAALPTWLTVSGATASYRTAATGRPSLILTASSTTGVGAQVSLTSTLNMNALKGLRLRVQGLNSGTTAGPLGDIVFGATGGALLSTALGAMSIVEQTPSQAAAINHGVPLVSKSVAYAPNSASPWGSALNNFRGLDVSFYWDVVSKQVYLMDREDVVGFADGIASNMVGASNNTVKPFFSFRAGTVGDTIEIGKLTLTCWYD